MSRTVTKVKFDDDAAVWQDHQDVYHVDNWYALYISIVRKASVGKALFLMGLTKRVDEEDKVDHDIDLRKCREEVDDSEVEEMIKDRGNGMLWREIAEKYNVKPHTAYMRAKRRLESCKQ